MHDMPSPDSVAAPMISAGRLPSWEDCHRMGLTVTEASKARGLVQNDAANDWAKAHGLRWPTSKFIAPNTEEAALPPLPSLSARDVDASACRALWIEVLRCLWLAVFPEERSHFPPAGPLSPVLQREREVALAWFGSADFYMVAALAGFDGGAVMHRLRTRLGSVEQVKQ